jgi:hypothetical protein
VAVAVAAMLLLLPQAAGAQSDKEIRKKSRVHYLRGIELAKEREYPAAIDEFERAYVIKPRYRILFNLGMAYVALNKPAEAVDALTRYLEQGGGEVKERRRNMVEEIIKKQRARIAHLTLMVRPDGAEIALDYEPLGKSPLTGPLKVGAGVHTLTVALDGYDTSETAVSVAADERKTVHVDLEPSFDVVPVPAAVKAPPVVKTRVEKKAVAKKPRPRKKPAERPAAAEEPLEPPKRLPPVTTGANGRLAIECATPDVTVVVDGRESERTPVREPLTLATGEHEIGFERPGYRPSRAIVTVPAETPASGRPGRTLIPVNAVGPIRSFQSMEPIESEEEEKPAVSIDCGVMPRLPLPDALAARLLVDTGSPQATVLVDGVPLPEGGRIPMGRHVLEIRRAGHHGQQREISLKAGGFRSLKIRLLPEGEPEDEEGDGLSGRTVAYLVGAGGLVLGAGAVALYVWNDSRFADWESERDTLDEAVLGETPHPPEVAQRQEENDDLLDSIHLFDAVTVGTAVAGGVLVATGAVLYFMADEPEEEARAVRDRFVATVNRDGGSIGWKVRW